MVFIDKSEMDVFDDKIMEAFITKTRQSEEKIGELEQNLKVKEAELEYVAKLYDNDKKLLTTELENATQKLSILEGKFNEIKHSNSIKDEEINNLKIEIADLNNKLSSRDEELSNLKKEVSNIEELRKEILTKVKLIEEQSAIIKQIETELSELKASEILNGDTTNGDRLICAKCGAVGKYIKTIEDKSKPLSYMGNIPMYAKYKVCKKCGNQF